jgi:ribosomal silencing factor RsfS
VVVHVFQPKIREFYDLERLWGDAKREVITDPQA